MRDEIRADLFTDLLLSEVSGNEPGGLAGVQAQVQVFVPAAVLGPATGEVHSVDRYRPSEQMRRFLRVRDQRCRFLGCRRPATGCDLDHTIDAAKGGPTTTTNLAQLCRAHHTLKHHTLKHHAGWRVTQRRDGVLDWVSPTGRGYTDRPPGTRVTANRIRSEPAPEPQTPSESPPAF